VEGECGPVRRPGTSCETPIRREAKLKRSAILVSVALAGCTAAEAPPMPDVPEVVGQIDLEIGLLEGPAEYTFGRVSGIAEAVDGQIFVSDTDQHIIRVFDHEGTFQRYIGREGEGPGEFGRPCCIAFGPDGHLWIRDSSNGRYATFDVTAERDTPEVTIRMSHFDGGLYAPITFLPDGSLVDVGHNRDADGTSGLWRAALSGDGTVQDRILVEEPSPEAQGTIVRDQAVAGGMARYYFPQPFGPTSLVAHGPDGVWATAASSQYVVTLRRGGETSEIRGPSYEGPTLSVGEQERARERVLAYVTRGGGSPSDYPEIPERKTPLAGLFFDQTGRIWVEVSVQEGEDHRADIYDGRGQLVETRIWPGHVSLRFPAWLGEDSALGISTDTLGVQRVVRVRF